MLELGDSDYYSHQYQMLPYQAHRSRNYRSEMPNMFLESYDGGDLDSMWRGLQRARFEEEEENLSPNPYPSVLGFGRFAPAQVIEEHSESNKRRWLPPIGNVRQNTQFMDSRAEPHLLQDDDGLFQVQKPAESENPDYDQQYAQLMNRIAYRYPNPGRHRNREGNIGASWRNVKEVLSYGGNRIVYIDGTTRVYDSSGLNDALIDDAFASARQRKRTPLFAPNRHDLQSALCTQRDHVLYQPNKTEERLPPLTMDYMNRVQHKRVTADFPNSGDSKHTIKGFYQYP